MKIAIANQRAVLVKDDSLVQNAQRLYIAEFVFDRSWDGFSKTAVFTTGSVSAEVPLTDGRCIIPSQCLERAGVKLRVGVYGERAGERRETVWCLTSMIMYKTSIGQFVPGGNCNSCPLPDDVRALILEVIRSSTAADAEVEDILNRTFGQSTESPENPDEGDCSDNTATDEEVDGVLNDVFGKQP